MGTKMTINYGPMRGILSNGTVISIKKDIETVHEFMKILEELENEEVTISIKHHKEVEESE